MKISELPPEIRALAEKNRAADTVQRGNQSDYLVNAFQFNDTPEGFDFWHKWHIAKSPADVAREQEEARAVLAALNRSEPVSPLARIPSPETLRPLLEAALALMAPNDPAKPYVRASLTASADVFGPVYTLYFYDYSQTPSREAYGAGSTPEAALETFKAKYQPPLTTAGRIAALKAELAKLEGARS